jgi:hypothetical protein
MARPANIVEALDGPFAAWLGDPAEWAPWRVVLKAMAALPLEEGELGLYRECTGRQEPPAEPAKEMWFIVGRRGRKSATAALLAVYQAVYVDWSAYRAPGETVRVLIVANSKDQAALVRSYAEAILRSRAGLERLIAGSDAETITLRNGIEIKAVANSFRSIRGPTTIAAIFEEVAYWRDENSANPDKEVLRAVKPSMLTVPGAVLIGISSPYARRGLLYERHRDHHGRDGRVLVWQADTLTMNPKADPEEIARAYEDDPEAAAAEYGARFRDDLSTFLDADTLARVVRASPLELPPAGGVVYQAFADPSGGRGDAFTLAIGHVEPDGCRTVDVVRSVRAPFDPAAVVHEYAELLRRYRLRRVVGDAYSGEWVVSAFRGEGIAYRSAAKPKSVLYLEALPLFTRVEVEVPDDRRLLVELGALERRTARGGRDSVDHPRGGRDDSANAVCGLLVELGSSAAFRAHPPMGGPFVAPHDFNPFSGEMAASAASSLHMPARWGSGTWIR